MKAIDESGKSAECTVRINVTDKNRFSPEFQELEYSFDICIFLGHGHATSTSGHIVNVLKTATCEE